MLYDIFYITTPGLLQPPVVTGPGNILVLETDGSAQSLDSCFTAATALPIQIPFCLLIRSADTVTPEAAVNIVAFFFFTNYYKLQGIPVVLCNNSAALEACAIRQGFEEIIQRWQMPILAAGESERIRQCYNQFLQEPVGVAGQLYVNIAKQTDIETINEICRAEETRFAQANQAFYLVKQQNKQLLEQVWQLERISLAAQQEIVNQREHNKILRSASQATALQNYYNDEYEVLPLWYKRLGHIVKVLIGKRTFKSLFNGNVKKYKH